MAISAELIKKNFENLSVEELKNKYEDLKKNYCFTSKEEQIEYIIKNYLNASNDINNNSTKIALEELLKEKTGIEYRIESKNFEINLLDIIHFITDKNADPFWTTTLTNYFQKLTDIPENDKMVFLIELIQNRDSFNEFTKEITQDTNVKDTFDKYTKIARDYVSKNKIIG